MHFTTSWVGGGRKCALAQDGRSIGRYGYCHQFRRGQWGQKVVRLTSEFILSHAQRLGARQLPHCSNETSQRSLQEKLAKN